MKKYILLTLEVESEYPEDLEDKILKETIEEAFESEFFCVPRSSKIEHILITDMHLEKFEEQKTSGAWEFISHNPNYSPFDCSPDSLYKCTNCGYTTGSTTKYCPMCGSKNQS